MVKGPLRQNKKMRKKGSNIGERIKILSGEDIRFDRIKSRIDAGCSVILQNIRKNENGLAYESSFENKKIYVALKSENFNIFRDTTLKFTGNDYEIASPRAFRILPHYGRIYKELNEKVQRLL